MLPALTCTIDLSKAPQAHIFLGDLEAVVGLDHDRYPSLGILTEFVAREEDAVALASPSPYSSSELV